MDPGFIQIHNFSLVSSTRFLFFIITFYTYVITIMCYIVTHILLKLVFLYYYFRLLIHQLTS